MQKCHLDYKAQESLGYQFHRANNSYDGNPRYVIHFLAFGSDYDNALELAKSLGFKRYRGRDFGGGFVVESYNLENTAEQIVSLRSDRITQSI